MQATKQLLQQHRQPMIKFIGKRATPATIDHTPKVHPASTAASLPESFTQATSSPSASSESAQRVNSFASYRQQAQQHGPLNKTLGTQYINVIGRKSGASLGSVEPGHGQYMDRSELGDKYGRLQWTAAEIEAVESGGASMFA